MLTQEIILPKIPSEGIESWDLLEALGGGSLAELKAVLKQCDRIVLEEKTELIPHPQGLPDPYILHLTYCYDIEAF